MRVHKCNHRGERKVSYEGIVVACDDHRITVRATWTRPTYTLPYVTLERGDTFIETFYTDRWYNIFEVHDAADQLKGWYADITRPARIAESDIEWDDLALDIWMNPDGVMLTLDADEFEALLPQLPAVEAASARGSIERLQSDLVQRWRDYANTRIAQGLMRRQWTLGTAESCTGGLIGDVITDRTGSSTYFAGGVISYSNEVKQRMLGVSGDTLARYGAVSEQCALEMARGVRTALGVHVGISATGIAGPDGGTASKPVGLIYVGLSSPLGEHVTRSVWLYDRVGNKQATANEALRVLMKHLVDNDR